MATPAQIKSNRNNAKKSTGPRTEEGKSRVSKNALKHGLLARDTVMPGEDPADFDRQLSALEADIQPANSLEFELVRQIADSQWRMRRLTRLETGFLAAALDETRRYMEKRRPDELRPGYDGETQLLGTAMLDRTQALVHLARYDGHLSRRFFRAVKQLRDLRRDESKAREARSSAGSYAPTDPDAYRGRYVPAQAPPPIGPPSPTAGRIGFRASRDSAPQLAGDRHPGGTFSPTKPLLSRDDCCSRVGRTTVPVPGGRQTTKQTQFRRTPMKSTPFKDETCSADLAVEIRGLCCAPPLIDNASPSGAASPHRAGNQDSRHMKASDSFVAHACLRAVSPFVATSSPVAHARSVPRRDSSRRLGALQPKTTKQTQFRRTPVRSTLSRDEPRSVDLAVEIRGLSSAPPLIGNVTPSGAASPHRVGNQDSGHTKASDSFVAHAFFRAVSPFVATSSPFVAHALSVPRRDSSRRLGAVQPKTTKQTQFRRTPVESSADCRSTNGRAARVTVATHDSARVIRSSQGCARASN